MKIYRLKWQQHLLLLGLLAAGYLFARWQHTALPAVLIRTIALFFVVMALCLVFFYAVKPDKPKDLSAFLAVYMGILVTIIIMVQHVVISHDLSFRNGIVLVITIVMPFIAGWLYGLIRKR